jgi:hypothetical protein
MKHTEAIMKTQKDDTLSLRPMSPCLRFFIQSLLADYDAEITIQKCLDADAIAGSAAFATSAPWAARQALQLRRIQ